jgi:hypothetical protein
MSVQEASRVRDLVAFALRTVERMQQPSRAFCLEVVAGDPTPRGTSLRYTLMTYIGLLKAEAAAHPVPVDIDGIASALDAGLGSPELTPGDYGLYLWADAVAGGGRGAELLGRLETALRSGGGLVPREGMELAWIVEGLALQVDAGLGGAAPRLLGEAYEHLLDRQQPSALFLHYGSGARRRFPNFATQIYSVRALATLARVDPAREARAIAAATRTSERLISLQLPDGGWPWLYDARRGTVVERYEVYSVHQDAMAPMALFELSEVTGERAHADAAVHGLGWLHGRNELGVEMLDEREGLLYRSIRRRRPFDRLALYANTAGSALAGVTASRGGPLEVNRTDRPYHLGWVLEAWSGREDFTGQPQ